MGGRGGDGVRRVGEGPPSSNPVSPFFRGVNSALSESRLMPKPELRLPGALKPVEDGDDKNESKSPLKESEDSGLEGEDVLPEFDTKGSRGGGGGTAWKADSGVLRPFGGGSAKGVCFIESFTSADNGSVGEVEEDWKSAKSSSSSKRSMACEGFCEAIKGCAGRGGGANNGGDIALGPADGVKGREEGGGGSMKAVAEVAECDADASS